MGGKVLSLPITQSSGSPITVHLRKEPQQPIVILRVHSRVSAGGSEGPCVSPRWVKLLADADIEAVHWSNLGAANAQDVDINAE